jgi:hypothetical protein
MKNSLLLLGSCIIAGAAFAQSEPDSIHLVMMRQVGDHAPQTLDTIVPVSQQQALFTWMNANGWDAPPPPLPGQPMMFEQEIVMNGDSSSSRMKQPQMIIIREGDAGAEAMPPLPPLPPTPPGAPRPPMPPMPPGQCKMVIVEDGKGRHGNDSMCAPIPPPPPGDVTMIVTEKDTVINGETRKMIIRTERIILPANPPAPTPAGNGKKPQPANGKRELVVYPNPASSVITVEFDVAAKEKTTLNVVDMNGKVVYTEEIKDEQGKHISREINLSGKGKGTYTVEVKSDKKVIAERVILQ